MKKALILIIASLALISCGQSSSKAIADGDATRNSAVQSDNASLVNVYYFHGKQRCKTCIAVGDVAVKTIADAYVNNSNVKFTEVDTSEKGNEALVEKYQVTWNALIIAKGDNMVDLTEKAFATAVNNPEQLTELIVSEVNSRL